MTVTVCMLSSAFESLHSCIYELHQFSFYHNVPMLCKVGFFAKDQSCLSLLDPQLERWHFQTFFLVCCSGPAKLGAFCWLGISLAIMEALVCVKFGRGIVLSNIAFLRTCLNTVLIN